VVWLKAERFRVKSVPRHQVSPAHMSRAALPSWQDLECGCRGLERALRGEVGDVVIFEEPLAKILLETRGYSGLCDRCLGCLEAKGGDVTGQKLWGAAEDAVRYFLKDGAAAIHSKSVLELGCGAGLVSIALMSLQAPGLAAKEIVMTDGNGETVDLATRNVALNGCPGIVSRRLEWCKVSPKIEHSCSTQHTPLHH
jgi:hypothetical protein